MSGLQTQPVLAHEGARDNAERIKLLTDAIAQLVVSRKQQVEHELRVSGRSRLARMVHELPNAGSEQLETIAINDLPTASSALALAAASSCVCHATQNRFKDACRCADVALIMIGIPLGQPLLDFITFAEENSILGSSQFIKQGSAFAKDKHLSFLAMKNMNAQCSQVNEGSFSVADFTRFFKNDKPVVIRRHATSWPSTQKWCDPTYLGNFYGHRTVPVEHTSSVEGMVEKFSSVADVINMMTSRFDKDRREKVYMAQHPLLDYIPKLRNDVYTPKYLSVVGKTKADLVNMWMGSSGTGTKLHFDSADNILVQLVGCKQLILIDPDQSHLLYQATPDDNISPVDITNPDFTRFPRFAEAQGMTIRLEAGDAVYIPAQHWHWVCAMSSSISVNFWF